MPTANLDHALRIVSSKFKGMTDKDGEPYILHCIRVMEGVNTPLAKQVAVMHDLVEDTDVTLADLEDMGFAPEVVTAVGLITHGEEDSYADYVIRLRDNELARQAKLSDLRDNSSITRVLYREDSLERDTKRIGRYILSYQFLTDRITETDYRRRMASLEEA